MILDFGSDLNFIHASDHKIYERLATTFLVAALGLFLILNLVLNHMSGYQLATHFLRTQKHKGFGI